MTCRYATGGGDINRAGAIASGFFLHSGGTGWRWIRALKPLISSALPEPRQRIGVGARADELGHGLVLSRGGCADLLAVWRVQQAVGRGRYSRRRCEPHYCQ